MKINYLGGGKGDLLPTDKVDPTQLSIGVQVEMEHTNDPKIAQEIALDHLSEDPEYYTKLIKAGLADEFGGSAGSGLGDPDQSFNDPARVGEDGVTPGNIKGSIGGTSDGQVAGRASMPIIDKSNNPFDGEGKHNKTIDIQLQEAKKKKKPKPTNPALWARAKAAARSKFDVYPSAYANGWAAKWYKSKGGGWRMSEDFDVSKFMPGSPSMFGSFGLPDKDQTSIDVKNVANALKNKLVNGAKELKRIFSEEHFETKEMLSILHKIHNNIEVTPEQRKKATQQFFDLLKLVGLAGVFKLTFKIPFSSEAIYGVAHLLNKYTGIQILPSSMMPKKVKEESVVSQVFDGPSPAEAGPEGLGTYGSGYDFVGYAENKNYSMKEKQLKESIKRIIRKHLTEQEGGDEPVEVGADQESVTITLDKDLAKKLHDLLMTQLAPEQSGNLPSSDQPQSSAPTQDDDQLPPSDSEVETGGDETEQTPSTQMSSDTGDEGADEDALGEITFEQSKEIEETKKQWIKNAIKPAKKGALHKQLNVPAGQKIPKTKLAAAAKKGGKLGKRARLAMTLSKLKKK